MRATKLARTAVVGELSMLFAFVVLFFIFFVIVKYVSAIAFYFVKFVAHTCAIKNELKGLACESRLLLLIRKRPPFLPSIHKEPVLIGAMLVDCLLALLAQALPNLGAFGIVNFALHHLACNVALALGGQIGRPRI